MSKQQNLDADVKRSNKYDDKNIAQLSREKKDVLFQGGADKKYRGPLD